MHGIKIQQFVSVWTRGPNQLVKWCRMPRIQMVMRVDTSDLSWFGQCKTLLPAEGDEAYITRTEVPVVGVTSWAGEWKAPSP
jgi:hypothetical protein